MDLFLTARMKPAAEFFAAYSSTAASELDAAGRSLLIHALANKDPASRYQIANILLDDGCPLGAPGAGGATVLHVLFGQVTHDIAADARLTGRLIERGADINEVDDHDRLPFLEVLNMKVADEQLAPVYDLWFAQPDPDFTTTSHHGVNPISFAAKLPFRAAILRRMEDHVSGRA